ncbi:MAG: hypothetical protein OEL76_04270 [Siculibacillus sp.]|nr:hypothetical protein [Siculibacillus sp.]
MALGKKLVLFSEVTAVVVNGGRPVAGAEVVQTVSWSTKPPRTSPKVVSDAAGRVHLPAVVETSLLAGFLPHEPVIEQSLVIRHDGREFEGWALIKHDYLENGETGGRALRLVCDLAAVPRYEGDWYGICRLEP